MPGRQLTLKVCSSCLTFTLIGGSQWLSLQCKYKLTPSSGIPRGDVIHPHNRVSWLKRATILPFSGGSAPYLPSREERWGLQIKLIFRSIYKVALI